MTSMLLVGWKFLFSANGKTIVVLFPSAFHSTTIVELLTKIKYVFVPCFGTVKKRKKSRRRKMQLVLLDVEVHAFYFIRKLGFDLLIKTVFSKP